MKSTTKGNPNANSVVRAQVFTQLSASEHSEPKTRNFVPLKIEDFVTGVMKAASLSIQAMMESFVYKSIKKLLQS